VPLNIKEKKTFLILGEGLSWEKSGYSQSKTKENVVVTQGREGEGGGTVNRYAMGTGSCFVVN